LRGGDKFSIGEAQKSKIPEAGFGDWGLIVSVSLAAALRALGNRADQLVLHAVADLACGFAAAGVDETSQCSAETILALSHRLLHAPRGLLPIGIVYLGYLQPFG